MDNVLAILFFVTVIYVFILFARQEHIEEYYEDAIIDIEGRLEWANTRKSFPFGMRSQLEVSRELLGKAKKLWQENKWHQAYRVALEAQKAINKAQSLYSSSLTRSQ